MKEKVIQIRRKVALLIVMLIGISGISMASGGHEEGEKFNPGEMIIGHIIDAHSIHLGSFTIPLPVILYTDNGIDMFSSSKFMDEHHNLIPHTSASTGNTYVLEKEQIFYADASGQAIMDEEGVPAAPLDLSITKTVLGMLIIMALMTFLFVKMARAYTTRKGKAPKGLQNFLEPLVLFIRDEVVVPSIGEKKAGRYLPFLLSLFFFIWMCNLLGLIPFLGGFNVTGTLAITMVMAGMVFIITTISGNKHYWTHILWPPGVPLAVKFILVPIEMASIFIKPIVLMVRLTANMTAGHILILAFVSLVILFGQGGEAVGAGFGVGVGAVIFMILMFFIELLVAFLQAYVFVLLASLYFGEATQEPHH